MILKVADALKSLNRTYPISHRDDRLQQGTPYLPAGKALL